MLCVIHNVKQTTEIFPPRICACAMPRATKVQQKVPILKKTTYSALPLLELLIYALNPGANSTFITLSQK